MGIGNWVVHWMSGCPILLDWTGVADKEEPTFMYKITYGYKTTKIKIKKYNVDTKWSTNISNQFKLIMDH